MRTNKYHSMEKVQRIAHEFTFFLFWLILLKFCVLLKTTLVFSILFLFREMKKRQIELKRVKEKIKGKKPDIWIDQWDCTFQRASNSFARLSIDNNVNLCCLNWTIENVAQINLLILHAKTCWSSTINTLPIQFTTSLCCVLSASLWNEMQSPRL